MALLNLVYRGLSRPAVSARGGIGEPSTCSWSGRACRVMVDLLAMAHERGCESELADQLDAALQAGRLPDMAALRQRFAPDPSRLPNVVVRLSPLNAYEALIGASLTGLRRDEAASAAQAGDAA
jgi:hypothetical protein